MNTEQAAQIIGVTVRRIRQLIKTGELRAESLSPNFWWLDKQSVNRYARRRRERKAKRKSVQTA